MSKPTAGHFFNDTIKKIDNTSYDRYTILLRKIFLYVFLISICLY